MEESRSAQCGAPLMLETTSHGKIRKGVPEDGN